MSSVGSGVGHRGGGEGGGASFESWHVHWDAALGRRLSTKSRPVPSVRLPTYTRRCKPLAAVCSGLQ
eukprot:15440222-Alexandrium_andersonii.AAC.1